MNRRDSIKSILLGSVATGITFHGCNPSEPTASLPQTPDLPQYGRTDKEKLRDQKLFETSFFNEHELLTIAVLCDIILPKSNQYNSASDTDVKEFIDFIVRDMEAHQIPLRGGIMWLDGFSNKIYNKEFVVCTEEEQLHICDQIAYPEETKPELIQGEAFFTRMRNLTLTGYYTSKKGIEELGYKGNTPNVWDGVPEHILSKHGFKYEEEWLAKCINNSNRGDVAKWDDKGNLIS
ncbi:gluconate 2-dehydrogenase subunit 3 family protein [Tamlana sp. 2201CG12-4]|uniref:gluconate 2-dehydrogenase subunit 3 family protein n=1 Tax=Tamlana sp. 2201CG12-4 TaxID=3112582 RepID=UPI002DBE1447|nr:gluconate 2-dehydrogenase subunit 3 family protein [Tamlana sp. 2201CG12-4]MEC3905653.1 gluconate 2-dehydrogenase subunit 3 family protein [Tamlana sp. 2201CG12-4]